MKKPLKYREVLQWTMRITATQLMFALLFIGTGYAREGSAQSLLGKKISIVANGSEVKKVLSQLEKQVEVRFVFSSKLIKSTRKVTILAEEKPLYEVLDQILTPLGLQYEVSGKIIILKRSDILPDIPLPSGQAPKKSVSGKVLDETNSGIPGVSVVLKGTQTGTTTDNEGFFQLQLPTEAGSEAVLVFSFVGYKTQEMAIGGQTVFTVNLAPENKMLSEVVVVGYGVQKKVNLTGSVSVVTADELAKRPVGQTSSALQGMVPGLTVTQRSGQPGRDGGNLRIRGVGTTGDSNPLVIVDGVESNINNIDPNEIESISVLKDASSAAIYGSRAANGVILITTKRGGNEKGLSVNYNMYAGWQTPTDSPDNVNGLDHMNLINEAYTNTGRSPLYSQQLIQDYITKGPSDRDQYPDTDWQKLTMKNSGFMQSHYIGMNGGNDKVRVLGSFSYLNQDGIIPNTGFKRYNLRINTDAKLSDKFSTSMDIFLRRTDLTEPSSGTGYIFHWMRRIPANQAGVLSTGQYGEGWNGDHPLARAKDGGINQESSLSSIINLNLKYTPTKWLTANLIYAPKFNLPNNKSFSNIVQTYRWDGSPSYAVPARNSLTESFSREWYNNIRATVAIDKKIAGDHQLNVLAGFQQENQRNNWISAYREVFILPDYQQINSGNRENERTGGSAEHWALQSFFGRVNYNYKEKYLFEANARYDGSSRFAAGNKYAIFPSFSAGWRIIQEPFMTSLSDVVTDLKLRASWGKLGNQNIGLYPFAAFVGIGNSNYVFDNKNVTGASLNEMANSNIRWESTTVSNIGVDLTLWSKFNLTAEYYQRRTNDILLRLDIPTMIGLTAPYQNAGVVDNKGWDLSMGYRDRVGAFNYNVTVNVSDVKNKVIDMRGVLRTDRQVNNEGYAVSSFYGYVAEGFFQTAEEVKNHAKQFGNVAPGDIKYKDLNEDGIINNLDQQVIGSPIPRYTYSTNVDLSYKGIDLSIFLQGVGKVDNYLTGHGIMPFFEGSTMQESQKDSWRPDNTDAAFPRLAFNESNNIQNSSFWLKNGSYLRVKNIQLGYNFPQSLLKNKIQRLRIYAGGQNLFTFDKFWPGFDVEAPVGNVGWYPQMKVYTVGLDVRF
ncbi:TonB-dependent receptor P26 [Dyadobacter sp. CECT 9275]|uniref:TonB-dependent receptor P26 n=1 Tax=Dyadobacter helix TaxID=2822344 RepID=A0A916JI09_9BACT|nr:TonB-dependent receptor [Dyadobacter sp. CECT 9275]CAG5005644.1 TonB-dependent receptor P26 [Dyadobacter sp. CECT 9275]